MKGYDKSIGLPRVRLIATMLAAATLLVFLRTWCPKYCYPAWTDVLEPVCRMLEVVLQCLTTVIAASLIFSAPRWTVGGMIVWSGLVMVMVIGPPLAFIYGNGAAIQVGLLFLVVGHLLYVPRELMHAVRLGLRRLLRLP